MSWLDGAKVQVWYCSKFDELHVIYRLTWNKYIAGMELDDDDVMPISWPRPFRKNDWHFVGDL